MAIRLRFGATVPTRIGTPLSEYACHEGIHGIVGILSGARAAEKAAHR